MKAQNLSTSLVEGRDAAPSFAHPQKQTPGTRATGNQGADLIAKRNGIKIAIQAKGYAGPVGNVAAQEIVGALRLYNAEEGWVVTNSTFTKSARSLAQANNARLIDGYDLKDFSALATLTTEPASTGPSVIFHDLSPGQRLLLMREFWKINSMCKLRMIARSR
jgi:hypothetical protein